MYTAKEAREATESTVSDEYLGEVLAKVKEAAEAGQTFVNVDIDSDVPVRAVMYRLIDEGSFDVSQADTSKIMVSW